jgi:hypothetical protein
MAKRKAKRVRREAHPCERPCTKVIKFVTDQELPPSTGMNWGAYTNIDGYRSLNVFVRFSQDTAGEQPVDLGVTFAFNAAGTFSVRRYVTLEENLAGPQNTNFIEVSGAGSWHGDQWKISTYVARFPVMGPYAQVFLYNRAPIKRTVSVWGYLVA